jgi:hypothetical protein
LGNQIWNMEHGTGDAYATGLLFLQRRQRYLGSTEVHMLLIITQFGAFWNIDFLKLSVQFTCIRLCAVNTTLEDLILAWPPGQVHSTQGGT